MVEGIIIQDTLKQKAIVRQDTIKQLQDSSAHKNIARSDSVNHIQTTKIQVVAKVQIPDTATSCRRSGIADVTFYDSDNIITRINISELQNFPFVFTGINKKNLEESKANLLHHLKQGEELPVDYFHNDWVLPVILLTILIYGIIKAESVKFFKGIIKFISFRGINESASSEMVSLFNWQSTLFNLASFINISLFAFYTILWYNVIPIEQKSIIYWLISLFIVISALTLRHFICIITGNISDEKEIFREYLAGIYQGYRLTGLLLMIVTVLILYTSFLPVKVLFYSGFSLAGLLYFVRAFRLFLIFINRHVSIFYLILYLCALEILPVVIIIKYVTGLV
jgi:hypothetical protein